MEATVTCAATLCFPCKKSFLKYLWYSTLPSPSFYGHFLHSVLTLRQNTSFFCIIVHSPCSTKWMYHFLIIQHKKWESFPYVHEEQHGSGVSDKKSAAYVSYIQTEKKNSFTGMMLRWWTSFKKNVIIFRLDRAGNWLSSTKVARWRNSHLRLITRRKITLKKNCFILQIHNSVVRRNSRDDFFPQWTFNWT